MVKRSGRIDGNHGEVRRLPSFVGYSFTGLQAILGISLFPLRKLYE